MRTNEKEDIITFESHIPDEVLQSLNSSYEQINSGPDEKEAATRAKSAKADSLEQQPPEEPWSVAKMTIVALLAIPTAVIIFWLVCQFPAANKATLSTDPLSAAHNKLTHLPAASGRSFVNLAAKSRGAYILHGYTTPPALSSWWTWSSRFRADPNCVILPKSQACWPVTKDSAIGLGFERMSSLISVNVTFASPSEPTASKFELSDLTPVEELCVYGLDSNGQIRRIGASRSTNVEIDPSAAQYAQIIVRIRLASSIPARTGCVRTIEAWGSLD